MDAYGNMIEATMFNQEVDKFLPLIEEGKVYKISNASVKIANQKFAKVKNDYCFNFHQSTNLTECKDTIDIAKRGFNFKNLSQITNSQPMMRTADLLVYIVKIGDHSEINTKNGVRSKRSIVVLDWSVHDPQI